MKPIFFALLAAGLVNVAAAQNTGSLINDWRSVYAQGRGQHSVDIDNDSLLLDRRDGFYSSGVRYTYSSVQRSTDEVRTAGWRIGQDLYTPSDINLPAAQVRPPDHPYAAWLYGGVFHALHRVDGTHRRIGLDLGCLGPCAGGEWTQTRFHRLLNQPEPRGWAAQVRNEFGIVLHGEFAPARWKPAAHIDLTPVLHGRFGNIYTDAGAGLTLRAGRLDELPGQRAFYGFARADMRAVAWNATLQGGYFSDNDPHTVRPERLVGEVEGGVAWADGPFALRAGVVRRGNEVKALPNSRGSQTFVRLQLVYIPD